MSEELLGSNDDPDGLRVHALNLAQIDDKVGFVERDHLRQGVGNLSDRGGVVIAPEADHPTATLMLPERYQRERVT